MLGRCRETPDTLRAMLTFILGGARSGKSQLAQHLARGSGREVLVLATLEPGDDEVLARIEQHRRERPASWRTIEEAIAVVRALEEAARPGDCVLFDCITVWISNLLLRHVSDVDHPASDEVAGASGAIRLELERLLEWCRGYDGQVIVVSNEVGMSVVPPYPLGRVFRDIVGSANQAVATPASSLRPAGSPLRTSPS